MKAHRWNEVFKHSIFGRLPRVRQTTSRAWCGSRVSAVVGWAAAVLRTPFDSAMVPRMPSGRNTLMGGVWSAAPVVAMASVPWLTGNPRALTFTMVLALTLANIAGRNFRNIGLKNWLFLPALAWMGFATLNPVPGDPLGSLMHGAGLGAAAWLAFHWAPRFRESEWVRWVGLSALALSMLAFAQTVLGWGDVAGWSPPALRTAVPSRAVGTFGNPNVLGAAANLLLWPFLFGLGCRGSRMRRVSAVAALGLVTAMFLTFSRGAWLGALAALGLLLTGVAPIARRTIIAVLTALAISVAMLPSGKVLHIHALEYAWSGRMEVWQAALACFARHPIMGAGPGSFRNVLLSGGHRAFHAHNMLFQVLAEWGIAGAVVFVGFVASLLTRVLRRAGTPRAGSGPAAGLGAGLTALLVQGMVDYPWASPAVSLLWWVMAGLFWGMDALESRAAGEGNNGQNNSGRILRVSERGG